MRKGLYKALVWSFARAGIDIDLGGCDYDRGDGRLILVPPNIPKILLVTKWPARLATALNRHNAASGPAAQVRLRIAVHAGEVVYDGHGVTGNAINRTFRLVQAPALKEALACSPGTCALIVSEWIYDEVVRHDPQACPARYRQVHVVVKETRATAWLLATAVSPGAASGPPYRPRIGGAGGGTCWPCSPRERPSRCSAARRRHRSR